jgi:hypothetical protein
MVNLFALRSPNPKLLKRAFERGFDPIGPDNEHHLRENLSIPGAILIYAWGNGGGFMGRGDYVSRIGIGPQCFGLTQQGEPKHPLYLPKTCELIAYPRRPASER